MTTAQIVFCQNSSSDHLLYNQIITMQFVLLNPQEHIIQAKILSGYDTKDNRDHGCKVVVKHAAFYSCALFFVSLAPSLRPSLLARPSGSSSAETRVSSTRSNQLTDVEPPPILTPFLSPPNHTHTHVRSLIRPTSNTVCNEI